MKNKNKLLSVRLSKIEMHELKQHYEARKIEMLEHCPSVDLQNYCFSDYVREVLAVRVNEINERG